MKTPTDVLLDDIENERLHCRDISEMEYTSNSYVLTFITAQKHIIRFDA